MAVLFPLLTKLPELLVEKLKDSPPADVKLAPPNCAAYTVVPLMIWFLRTLARVAGLTLVTPPKAVRAEVKAASLGAKMVIPLADVKVERRPA